MTTKKITVQNIMGYSFVILGVIAPIIHTIRGGSGVKFVALCVMSLILILIGKSFLPNNKNRENPK